MSDQEAQQDRMREQKRLKEEQQMNVAAEQTSQQLAAEAVEKNHMNPEMLEKFQDLGISGETFQWVLEEASVELAGGHAVGNREEGYTRREDHLSKNTAEMLAAEASPGRILRENPGMHVVSLGLHKRAGEGKDALDLLQKPATPKETRAIRALPDLITNQKSKAEGGRLIAALTEIITERKEQSSEQSETTAEQQSKSLLR